MTLFKHVPLRRKLTWLTMICSVVALLTTAIALGTYEWIVYQRTRYTQIETVSAMAARNSTAALALSNQVEASRVLSALETEPAVLAAALYDLEGRQFAVYRRDGSTIDLPLLAPPEGRRPAGAQLDLAVPVQEGQRFGTLLVRADVSQIRERLLGYLRVLLATTAGSGLLALLLAIWLTKRLVAPVQTLVTAASGVKTNESELEAHVKARTRELEAANQELESFSYSVSHDLRGPVRAILGFSEIALEDCQAGKPEAAIERLQRVIRAAERMNKLIDAFIGMARISRTEPVFDTVNLSRLADEIVGFLRSAAPVPRAIEVAVAPGLECQGDERLLRIVLENLLGNAWKFTARQKNPRIEFGANADNGERVFFVRDNGAGFNSALGYKLFHAFERLHDASQFEGLGVGLNTVQRVIEKHAGRVWAEGREGDGATFYFTIGVRSGSATKPDNASVVAAAGR